MKRVFGLAAFSTLCAVSPLLANMSVDLRETATTPNTALTIFGKNFLGGQGAEAGVYRLDVGPVGHATWDKKWGFCIEMQYSSNAWQRYDVVDLDSAPMSQGNGDNPNGSMGINKADALKALWAQHINEAVDSNGVVIDNVAATAFQVAVWEIVYENLDKWDVSSWAATNNTTKTNSFKVGAYGGNTQVYNDVVAKANGWLDNLDMNGPKASLMAYSNKDYQDYVFAVPAPAAAFLGFFGLGIVGWIKRRIA